MARVEYSELTARLNESEMWTICFALKDRIESAINNIHYEMHPDSFEQNLGAEINLLKALGGSIGRPDLAEQAVKTYSKWREKLKGAKR